MTLSIIHAEKNDILPSSIPSQENRKLTYPLKAQIGFISLEKYFFV